MMVSFLCKLKIHKWKPIGGIFYEEQCDGCGLIKEYHSVGCAEASWEEYHYPNKLYSRDEAYERSMTDLFVGIALLIIFCSMIWAGIILKPWIK